eukprot:TRINITY_DN1149_c0_g3_i1.p1 TRINITY_DN1149_c0_g3~~TRINITY_DN1149_c0_g3_i1.p1  ORF type:complete len:630 (-),score=209.56 TRINITY_DN1149_c0_g3_i1:304-2193(-)
MGAGAVAGIVQVCKTSAKAELEDAIGQFPPDVKAKLVGACTGPLRQPGKRELSLPKAVAAAGGIDAWNDIDPQHAAFCQMLDRMVLGGSVEEVLTQAKAMVDVGNYLYCHTFMKMVQAKHLDLYYAVLLKAPSTLLPVMYTPTVGEICQKFGKLPFYRRGCYLSLTDKGNFKAVLKEYAEAELEKDASGKPLCDCMVFSDGGRILGLGDLGAWGMGIPLGKLDLYTVCGGVNPHRVIPVIVDVGCGDSSKNTDGLSIREHPRYTGLKQDRVMHKSEAGTMVNSCYYGEGNIMQEFMEASTELFGKNCLLQFEDFNSNDAFPLLEEYRSKFLCYNDDIQGTAGVAVAGILGAIKLKKPDCQDLIAALKDEVFLFHGAGSAAIGIAQLLAREAGVPMSQIFMTGSRGLLWKSEDGSTGVFKNNEQKEFAHVGKPDWDVSSLLSVIENAKPSIIMGAVGVCPNCFTKDIVDAAVKVCGEQRPVIFALSNPKTQAEITAENCYKWTNGRAIFGSGTYFDPVTVSGKKLSPGQVNNVYIFPGMSFAAIAGKLKSIPDKLFLAAAEAVASSLSPGDFEEERIVPHRDEIRNVGLNVATAVVLEAQKLGLAQENLGADSAAVKAALSKLMWLPSVQ